MMSQVLNARLFDEAFAENQRAQAALQYTPTLFAEARRFLAALNLTEGQYLAAHWRRDR